MTKMEGRPQEQTYEGIKQANFKTSGIQMSHQRRKGELQRPHELDHLGGSIWHTARMPKLP
jgi:hypothetical protein